NVTRNFNIKFTVNKNNIMLNIFILCLTNIRIESITFNPLMPSIRPNSTNQLVYFCYINATYTHSLKFPRVFLVQTRFHILITAYAKIQEVLLLYDVLQK